MAETTVTSSWGRPLIEVKQLGQSPEAEWEAFATPVDGTTQLSSEQGEKLEAAIEGGGNEAVKYKKNTYSLTFDVRQVPERTDPIEESNGVVADEYSVRITPENPNALGVLIDRASVNVQKSFTANDGLIKTYTFEVLEAASGEDVKFQKIVKG